MSTRFRSVCLVAGAALSLTACGGGSGGAGVNSTPIPPPAPPPSPSPPAPSAAVDIFQSPASQEFAATGIGSDLRIRYDAGTKTYEVLAAGDWVQLVDDPLSSPLPGRANQMFVFAGAPTNQSIFILHTHYSFSGYQYSAIAQWGGPGEEGGLTAFGIPTPTGAVPVVGNATYQGSIDGLSTVPVSMGEWGTGAADVSGTVTLDFNFGSGSLNGEIRPRLNAITAFYDLPTLTFRDTVFGAGSTTFSGAFSTNSSGPNAFSGRFTGPDAQEVIGKWAFPFVSPIDQSQASAAGAMIAKRGN